MIMGLWLIKKTISRQVKLKQEINKHFLFFLISNLKYFGISLRRACDFWQKVIIQKASPLTVIPRYQNPVGSLFRLVLGSVVETSRDELGFIILSEQLALRVRQLLGDERGKIGDDALDGMTRELTDDLFRHRRNRPMDAQIEQVRQRQYIVVILGI